MTLKLLSVLRIVAALLYLVHGTVKLFGFPGDLPPAPLVSLNGLAGVIETAAGALLLLGAFTRPVACVAAVESAVAYVVIQIRQGFLPFLAHGDLALLFCALFLYMSFAGPGPWSLDARRDAPPDDIRTTGARRLK